MDSMDAHKQLGHRIIKDIRQRSHPTLEYYVHLENSAEAQRLHITILHPTFARVLTPNRYRSIHYMKETFTHSQTCLEEVLYA